MEFHLRQALGAASKPGTGEEGQEVARTAAESLSLLLCQEGRDKEAAKVLKRQGFRYTPGMDHGRPRPSWVDAQHAIVVVVGVCLLF